MRKSKDDTNLLNRLLIPGFVSEEIDESLRAWLRSSERFPSTGWSLDSSDCPEYLEEFLCFGDFDPNCGAKLHVSSKTNTAGATYRHQKEYKLVRDEYKIAVQDNLPVTEETLELADALLRNRQTFVPTPDEVYVDERGFFVFEWDESISGTFVISITAQDELFYIFRSHMSEENKRLTRKITESVSALKWSEWRGVLLMEAILAFAPIGSVYDA